MRIATAANRHICTIADAAILDNLDPRCASKQGRQIGGLGIANILTGKHRGARKRVGHSLLKARGGHDHLRYLL